MVTVQWKMSFAEARQITECVALAAEAKTHEADTAPDPRERSKARAEATVLVDLLRKITA